MKPESEWFRPPKLRELCSEGDTRRWLYIAEPELGEGCYGVGYEVSMYVVEKEMLNLDALHEAALAELRRRVELKGWARPEGSHWRDFLWKPTFKREAS